MVRLRNEAEFLEAAVHSIAGLEERIVLVDNLSTDRTPEIIERLLAAYPQQAEAYRYPHAVARVGSDQRALDASGERPDSPRLLATYYNWCLARCRTESVLKWDGDMIALPELGAQIAAWRASGRPILAMNGANVHPDRRHLIAARIQDKAALAAQLTVPGLPAWASKLTYDHPEPRLFPRAGAQYDTSLGWVERLASPHAARELKDSHRFRAPAPSFLHMKFCKADPWVGYSPELARVIAGNVIRGPAMPDAWRAVLEAHGHG
jgi:glycosyltransferase involved in cell wall biosynthesis